MKGVPMRRTKTQKALSVKEALNEAYIKRIMALLRKCGDTCLLDLIEKLLKKSV